VFELYSQLPKNKADLRKHIAALAAMTNVREHQELFNHLYDCLSILDAKSTSLLSFNSIITAVFAIFMASEPHGFESIAVHLGMAMVLVSCFLLLSVVWVHWSTTANLEDRENHALILLEVRRTRTIKYRLAWYFSVAGMIALSLFLAARIIGASIQHTAR
jgi:hypothetical protein